MRIIRVLEGYRGRSTNEQYIAPREYEDTDPALYGLTDFLIGTGRAGIIREVIEVPPADEGDATPQLSAKERKALEAAEAKRRAEKDAADKEAKTE